MDAADDGFDGGEEAGWTQCASPSGYAVCGGTANCPTNSDACSGSCSASPLGACGNAALLQFGGPNLCADSCADGDICVAYFNEATAFFCAPFDLGVLFAQNGATDRVRYADMGSWTGQSLPLPATCPTVPGVQVCGGNCGACLQGDVCTGRSPLHPYSFCAPPSSGPCSAGSHDCGNDGGTLGCLTFTVDSAAQSLANTNGLCLPRDICLSVAAGLPGGATCSP
jgi:hypothetical protein